jgi:hypothetical protein
MNATPTVFAQIMAFLPLHEFRKCVKLYRGDYKIKTCSCLDQFLCLPFAQLTYRESLSNIAACLRTMKHRLCHMGIRSNVSRNNWPMPTKRATSESSPTSPESSSPKPVDSIKTKISDWISRTQFTLSIRQRSIYASRFSPGPFSAHVESRLDP